MSYSVNVYHPSSNPNEMVVGSSGYVTVQSGGQVDVESGGRIDLESGGYIDIAAGGYIGLPITTTTSATARLTHSMGIEDITTVTDTGVDETVSFATEDGPDAAGIWKIIVVASSSYHRGIDATTSCSFTHPSGSTMQYLDYTPSSTGREAIVLLSLSTALWQVVAASTRVALGSTNPST